MELQTPICGGTEAATSCTVTVLSFTDGSTNINGQTTHIAGQGQTIQSNVQNNVVGPSLAIVALAGTTATSSAVSQTNFARCSATDLCGIDEGDCDTDADCNQAGVPLKCGINNCPANFDPLADCCYDPAAVKTSQTCDGGSSNMWTCCRDRSDGCDANADTDGSCGCAVGQGDCDSDDQCSGSLVCGRNSCDTAFNTKVDANSQKFFPSGQADCCISKSRALFYGIPSRSDLEENFQNDDEPF